MNVITILSDAILTEVTGGCLACGGPNEGASHLEQVRPGRKKREDSSDGADYDYGNMIFMGDQDTVLP